MKTLIKKFQQKDKDSQVREDEAPLMMSLKIWRFVFWK